MRRHMTTRLAVATAVTMLAGSVGTAAMAQSWNCTVSDAVRSRIETLLCGGAPEYSFSGARCFELSLAQRLRDTEAQAARLEDCGHPDLAEDVRSAALETAGKMNVLAACLPGGQVDVGALAESAADTVHNRGKSRDCTAADARLLEQRLPDFRALVQRAGEPAATEELYRAVGVRVGADGTISDR